MSEKIFPRPAIEAKHRKGFLGAYFDCFINWMQKRGYSRVTTRHHIQNVTHFGNYLEQRGLCSIYELEGERGQKFLEEYRQNWKPKGHWARNEGLPLYRRAIHEAGVIRSLASSNSQVFDDIEQYRSFLKSLKGLDDSTVNYHIYWAEKFLRFLGLEKAGSAILLFGIGDVDKFLAQEGAGLKRTTQQKLTYVLRSFLKFLYQSGKVNRDLSILITSPVSYKMEALPSVLSWEEVKKILQSVDLSTKVGLQHYAILILLTTYGLRAGEVAQLKLDDINWRKDTLHVAHSKTGRDLWLPLTSQVGKAILNYLKHARPCSKYREVFLLTCAPWHPLKGAHIGRVVRRHIELAGLNPAHKGSHLFRHSFATHLLRGGVSLKEIGDMLGHRSLESTHIYTKTATENLREVALEVPEV